jgi:diguanylate cyclase (GGDEF)-like protein
VTTGGFETGGFETGGFETGAFDAGQFGQSCADALQRRLAAERDVRSALEAALDVAADGLALFGAEAERGGPRLRLRYANQAARAAFGLNSGDLLAPCLPPRPAARIWSLVWEAIRRPDRPPGRVWLESDALDVRADVAPGPWDLTVAPAGPGQAVVTWRDAADGEAARRRLETTVGSAERSVTHDALTGLPNGALLRGTLAAALARPRSGRRVAVVLATLNGLFDSASRRYGSAVGTGLLTATADRLRAQLARGDVAARVGADTFGLLLRYPVADVDPRRTLDRLAARLDRPLAVRSTLLVPRSSLGLVLADPWGGCGDPERDADALILQAFEAMQRSKTAGEPVVATEDDVAAEQARVEAVESYDIHDGALDDVLGAAARMAAAACSAPRALVTFVDGDLQWVRASIGDRVSASRGVAGPRHLALCDVPVKSRTLVVMTDLRGDPRCANRHVSWQEKAAFYAGAPLVDPHGRAVGTLCVLDDAPRDLTGSQRHALTELADVVMNILVARRPWPAP